MKKQLFKIIRAPLIAGSFLLLSFGCGNSDEENGTSSNTSQVHTCSWSNCRKEFNGDGFALRNYGIEAVSDSEVEGYPDHFCSEMCGKWFLANH